MTAPQLTSDEKLRALHERLTAAVADLTRGDAWQTMLHAAAKFHHYSPTNILLIASQSSEATAVAGFQTWRQLGRQVRKGEKGIAILAPVLGRHPTNTPAAEPPAESPVVGVATAGARMDRPVDPATAAASRRVAGFRVVHVFDISQTDGADLPTAPAPALLDGLASTALYDGLADHIRDEGFQLLRHDLTIPHLGEGKANGVTDYLARTVIVAQHLPAAQATKTLAHELGHVLLHRPDNRPTDLTRPRAEVEAESVAYVVTAAHGLDSHDYTVPYVTGWAGGDVTMLQQTAERVLSTAQTILRRTPPPPTHCLPAGTARHREPPGTERDDTQRTRDPVRTNAPSLSNATDRPAVPTGSRLVSASLEQGAAAAADSLDRRGRQQARP